MRINVSISEELLNEIDKRAKRLNLSRSSYLAMTASYRMEQEDLIEKLPEMFEAAKRMQQEIDKLRAERQNQKEESEEK